jgi:hypothetical protein
MAKLRLSIVIAMLGIAAPARAKIDPMSLDELLDASDLVVLARVESIESPRTATARVLATWRGLPQARVRYDAAHTSTCDTSFAAVGETVVLFLTAPGQDGVRITNYGQGRFEVHRLGDGRDYASLSYASPDFVPGARVARFRRPDGTDDRLVNLADFEKAVRLRSGPRSSGSTPRSDRSAGRR